MTFRRFFNRSIALAVLSGLAVPAAIALAPLPASAYSEQERYFDREQIEQLTAPIALYPDPLLAQILSAASYPDEIAQAQRYVQGRHDWNGIDQQDWDYSVRAIARYPEVLDFLARDLEWTEALGIANINQPDDVADAIQRWRLQAYNLGNLRSGSQQTIYVEDSYVRIVPAEQDYFYVPRYEPNIVYVTRYVGTPFLIFGPAYTYGSWFDRDWDWRRRRICFTDRRHWHNGRPVFHAQFDRVHGERDWKPDGRRFKPPARPHMPPRLAAVKVPSPPQSVRPGARQDHDPRNDGRDRPREGGFKPGDRPDRDSDRRDQVKPAERPDNPNDPRKFPTVRRGSDRDYTREDRPSLGRPNPNTTPEQRNVEQPRRVEPPKVEHSAPQRVEQPRRMEQPARVEPTRRIEQREEPRGHEQQRKAEQPRPQPQVQQPQRSRNRNRSNVSSSSKSARMSGRRAARAVRKISAPAGMSARPA